MADRYSSPMLSRYPGSIHPPSIRPSGPFSIEQRTDDLWMFIGPRRRREMVTFFGLVLIGWAFGEIAAVAEVVKVLLGGGARLPGGRSANPDELAPLFVFCLFFWTIGGVYILRLFLSERYRWEEIYLSRTVLFKRIRLGPWKRDKLIHLQSVQEIRLTTPDHYPEDWQNVRWRGDRGIGIAVQYGRNKVLLLVHGEYKISSQGRENVVARVLQALDAFRIPVTPLGQPKAPDLLKPFVAVRDEYFSTKQEETREEGPVRPTGPEPFSQSVRRWTGQLLLVVLLLIAWVFWIQRGGVPSVLFAILVGYIVLFIPMTILSTIRGILRTRAGKRWSPPPTGTWKDEWIGFVAGILVSGLIGGAAWVGLLFVSSRDLGRWDLARRRVYSVGSPVQSAADAAGNRYEIYAVIDTAGARLHRFGPDGKLRWVLSLPPQELDAVSLTVRPDGSIEFQNRGKPERFTPAGVPILVPESDDRPTSPGVSRDFRKQT